MSPAGVPGALIREYTIYLKSLLRKPENFNITGTGQECPLHYIYKNQEILWKKNGMVVHTKAMWNSKRMSKTSGRSLVLVALTTTDKLGEVLSDLTKCTSPNRLLLSNHDKRSTAILAHSLALPHGPGLLNVSN